jgi:hypothetical protein
MNLIQLGLEIDTCMQKKNFDFVCCFASDIIDVRPTINQNQAT